MFKANALPCSWLNMHSQRWSWPLLQIDIILKLIRHKPVSIYRNNFSACVTRSTKRDFQMKPERNKTDSKFVATLVQEFKTFCGPLPTDGCVVIYIYGLTQLHVYSYLGFSLLVNSKSFFIASFSFFVSSVYSKVHLGDSC